MDRLLPWLRHLSSALGQALQKQKQKQEGIREPGGSQRNSCKLSFPFELTQIGHRMSQSAMAIFSDSSLFVAATHEHAYSALLTTCL
jgi:hypothetical protein